MSSAVVSSERIRVLIVEDNPGDAFLISHLLEDIEDQNVEAAVAGSLEEAFARLREESFSLIFTDLGLPDSSGFETVERMLGNRQNIPVVVLTGTDDRELALDSIRFGAQDFLEKDLITADALSRVITHSLERHSLNRALRTSLEDLEAANQRFVKMLGDLTDAVVVVDLDGKVLFVNRATEEMFDKDAGEMLGEEFGVSFNTSEPVEVELVGRAGRSRIAEVRVVETEWDNRPALIASLRDISDRKRVERAMLVAQQAAETANEMKSRFLANMSHELRTPLNSIIGFSEIIRDESLGSVGNDRYRDYAGDIHHSGHHLLSLINDLLDLSKAEADRYDIVESEFDLVASVRDAVRLIQPQASAKSQLVGIDSAFAECSLRAGERQITQVLVNLLSNAIKFTPERGAIRVSIRPAAQGGVAIDVVDNGIGIEPDEIPKLFNAYAQVGEPYLKAKERGTGLGLALSKRLIELHGGFVRMKSTPREGTTVSVVMPRERVCHSGGEAARVAVG